MFDPTLSLTGWERSGIGDLAVIGRYLQCFPQDKPYLKNVGIMLRAGLTIPTGKTVNVDEPLSVPFGFDGSWGVIGNMGIWCNWFDCIRGGINFQFLHLFGNTRTRRFMTQLNQTEMLFLAKGPAYLDFGFTQEYNLFAQAYHIVRGFSIGLIYEFTKHSRDTITLCTDQFSSIVANRAQSLQEWTFHEIIMSCWYDFFCDVPEDSSIKPQLQFFWKLPITGKRVILVDTVGLGLTLNF
jgi:hypothetical protein